MSLRGRDSEDEIWIELAENINQIRRYSDDTNIRFFITEKSFFISLRRINRLSKTFFHGAS
jgi:hypothetical protein